MRNEKQFINNSDNIAFDLEHRKKINFNIGKYNQAVTHGLKRFTNLELAKTRASYLKWRALENLPELLLEFEQNFTARGGRVIWAVDAQEAVKEVIKIFNRHRSRLTVKSKTMIAEEIHLNEALEKNGIQVCETDLGEFIVQQAGEQPYHIVTPAMHKSKEDIALLYQEKFQLPPNSSPEAITEFTRKFLRSKYAEAEIGISGANFLLADVGAIAITENEGNARLATTMPQKAHIVLAGIEKVLQSINDLDLMWPLLATHGTGQFFTVYNSILAGPRQASETDGPNEMYVILIDNGRTNLLAEPEQRQALKCIRCGACLNTCPVYKNIGGHAYATTYSGPIGAVINPHLGGQAAFKHLSHASTLCGSCTEVCPVKIELHKLLLLNRKDAHQVVPPSSAEKITWQVWRTGMMNRKFLNIAPSLVKQISLEWLMKEPWGKRRVFPKLAPKSFNELWRSRNKTNQ